MIYVNICISMWHFCVHVKTTSLFQGTGVYLRGQKMKMPASVGNKKSKAVEQLLDELSVDVTPMPTEDICHNFNELRSQLLLLYELRQVSLYYYHLKNPFSVGKDFKPKHSW